MGLKSPSFDIGNLYKVSRHREVGLLISISVVIVPAYGRAVAQGSPICGMPIIEVDSARHTIVMKRSLSPEFAGSISLPAEESVGVSKWQLTVALSD